MASISVSDCSSLPIIFLMKKISQVCVLNCSLWGRCGWIFTMILVWVRVAGLQHSVLAGGDCSGGGIVGEEIGL